MLLGVPSPLLSPLPPPPPQVPVDHLSSSAATSRETIAAAYAAIKAKKMVPGLPQFRFTRSTNPYHITRREWHATRLSRAVEASTELNIRADKCPEFELAVGMRSRREQEMHCLAFLALSRAAWEELKSERAREQKHFVDDEAKKKLRAMRQCTASKGRFSSLKSRGEAQLAALNIAQEEEQQAKQIVPLGGAAYAEGKERLLQMCYEMGFETERKAWKRLENAWPRRAVESGSLEPDAWDAAAMDPDEEWDRFDPDVGGGLGIETLASLISDPPKTLPFSQARHHVMTMWGDAERRALHGVAMCLAVCDAYGMMNLEVRKGMVLLREIERQVVDEWVCCSTLEAAPDPGGSAPIKAALERAGELCLTSRLRNRKKEVVEECSECLAHCKTRNDKEVGLTETLLTAMGHGDLNEMAVALDNVEKHDKEVAEVIERYRDARDEADDAADVYEDNRHPTLNPKTQTPTSFHPQSLIS